MTQQTRRGSMIEALTSTAIGFCVALCGQVFIMWWYGLKVSLLHNAAITLFFTGLSIIRGYSVRRLFNWLLHKDGGER